MQLPSEVPLMTLPNGILFPDAMLPLYIFEPRYRQMLSDALHSNRMFTVAMQKPGRKRESPCQVGGLGLIRASVAGKDGTSHLILQGLARVELVEAVRYKPYRVQRIRALETTEADSVAVDALGAKVVELVSQRLEQGSTWPAQMLSRMDEDSSVGNRPNSFSIKQVVEYLTRLDNPDRLADLVSCTLLSRIPERQIILETANLEQRLKHLIHFLMDELQRNSNGSVP
jgi:Lon protease-like protein